MMDLSFHQVYVKLKNISYPLKDPTLNSIKLNKTFFENIHNLRNNDFQNCNKMLSLRQMRH